MQAIACAEVERKPTRCKSFFMIRDSNYLPEECPYCISSISVTVFSFEDRKIPLRFLKSSPKLQKSFFAIINLFQTSVHEAGRIAKHWFLENTLPPRLKNRNVLALRITSLYFLLSLCLSRSDNIILVVITRNISWYPKRVVTQKIQVPGIGASMHSSPARFITKRLKHFVQAPVFAPTLETKLS